MILNQPATNETVEDYFDHHNTMVNLESILNRQVKF
jgi:hypothetical protein